MWKRVKVDAKKPEVNRDNVNSRMRGGENSRSMDMGVEHILYLQRTAGNQVVQRLIRSGALQAKLKIGQQGDKYEQEADRVVDEVMRMPEPGVQRRVGPEEGEELIQTKALSEQITPLVQCQEWVEDEEEIQTKPLPSQTSEVVSDVETSINSIRGGGQPLPGSTRAFFEPRFGQDFSQVRLHTDTRAAESARAVNARAFTLGRDVVFGAGQYAPGTSMGRRLMGHELTHVVQQGRLPRDRLQSEPVPIIQREANQPANKEEQLTGPLTDREWQHLELWQSSGEVGIVPLTENSDHNALVVAEAILCSRILPSLILNDTGEDPLLCIIGEVTRADPRVKRLVQHVTARGPIINWTRNALIKNASDVIERGGGVAKFEYLPADLEWESSFIWFDDSHVQKLYRYLFKKWFGVTWDESLDTTPDRAVPPRWVGEFRAKALNVRHQKTGNNDDHAYREETQLADLAVKLADSIAPENPAQEIRREFVKEADERVGTTVLTLEETNKIINGPASEGFTPANFSTCITFFTQVTAEVGANVNKSLLPNGLLGYKETNPDRKKNLPSGAWVSCTPNIDARPKPGDPLIFTYVEDVKNKAGEIKHWKGNFAHISILRSIELIENTSSGTVADIIKNECSKTNTNENIDKCIKTNGNIEKWISIGGGGTTVEEVTYHFFPDSCIIIGPKARRTVSGWINIEKLADKQKKSTK